MASNATERSTRVDGFKWNTVLKLIPNGFLKTYIFTNSCLATEAYFFQYCWIQSFIPLKKTEELHTFSFAACKGIRHRKSWKKIFPMGDCLYSGQRLKQCSRKLFLVYTVPFLFNELNRAKECKHKTIKQPLSFMIIKWSNNSERWLGRQTVGERRADPNENNK